MRNSVLRNFPGSRFSFAACLALLISLAIAGCGGGGGSSTNTGGGGGGGNTSLAVVSGTVVDSSGANVTGAVVSITGTSLSAITGSNGNFQINNVPLNAVSFSVSSPNVTEWYNSGTYDNVRYNFGTDASACAMPLPTPLQAASKGPNPLLTVITLDVNSGSPPAPPLGNPPAGCPGHQ